MSEEKGNKYNKVNEVMKGLVDFSNDDIEELLSDANNRIENAMLYNQDNLNTNKNNPLYYKIGNVQNMHNETTSAYYNYASMNDLSSKVSIMGKLVEMDNILNSIEEGDGENE